MLRFITENKQLIKKMCITYQKFNKVNSFVLHLKELSQPQLISLIIYLIFSVNLVKMCYLQYQVLGAHIIWLILAWLKGFLRI